MNRTQSPSDFEVVTMSRLDDETLIRLHDGELSGKDKARAEQILAEDEAVVRDSDGDLHAVSDICTHQDVSLSEGDVEGCDLLFAEELVPGGGPVVDVVVGRDAEDEGHHETYRDSYLRLHHHLKPSVSHAKHLL